MFYVLAFYKMFYVLAKKIFFFFFLLWFQTINNLSLLFYIGIDYLQVFSLPRGY